MEQTTQPPSEHEISQEPTTAPPVSVEQLNTPSISLEVAAADADESVINITTTLTQSNAEVEGSKTSSDLAVPFPDVAENDGKDSGCIDENKIDESSTDADQKELRMSREMRSLINSAKDSKIISEFTQIKTKMRKPRMDLDTSTGSLNTSVEAEKLQGSRRSSSTSLVSSSSDVSDKPGRRSMRSINPEFVNKQRKFLNSLSGKPRKVDVDVSHASDSESTDDEHAASNDRVSQESITETADADQQTMNKNSDKYCWRCHWLIELPLDSSSTPHCSLCPRSYHPKCLHGKAGNADQSSWVCPECMTVLHAENSESRSPAMQKTSLSTLCTLLNYALARMKLVKGVDVFLRPVDVALCMDYPQHVVRPMDLSRLQQNIVDGVYGSTEAFMADTMWILHNCLVYNSPVRSNLTGAARALVRECRNQMGEIEACPECYAAAHARRPTWFTDVCSTPHILLWAKLKGFPFWPAKGMSVNDMGMVDVRFFGDHDRAWVPAKYCYLYCQKDPNNSKTQRTDILASIKEAEQHIKNITRKFGSFVHAMPRTLFEPARHAEQLKMMIPGYQGTLPAPKPVKEHANSPANKAKRQRSMSKGSKESILDGYVSEEEGPGWRRKTPAGDDTAHDDDNVSSANKSSREQSVEVDVVSTDKSPMRLGKRRKTVLEEPTTFTVLETNSKKRRTSSHETTLVKGTLDEQEEKKELVVDDDKTSKDETFVEVKVKEPLKINSNKTEKTDFESLKKDGYIKENVSEDISKDKDTTTKSTLTSNKLEEDSTTKSIKSPIKSSEKPVAESTPKLCKDRIVFVDDILSSKPLAKKTVTPETKFSENKSSEPKSPEAVFIGLPTITSVCSLATDSETISSPEKNSSPPKATSKYATPVDTNTMARVFKVSRKGDSVGSMKEAVAKLQKLRDVDTPVSTTSTVLSSVSTTPAASTVAVASIVPVATIAPVSSIAPVASTAPVAMQVDIEIKAEPIDYEEVLNSVEKNEMLGSLNLRPTSSLEIEPTMKTVDLRTIRRVVSQKTNVAPRARKTFPQARKNSPLADDNRDLNGKNSMVYIPIQPPTPQVPVRVTTSKPNKTSSVTLNASSPQRSVPFSNSPAINTITTTTSSLPTTSVNTPMPTLTVATNLMPASRSPPPATSVSTVPAAATTVPSLMQLSSLNGQWTLCLPSLVNMETPPLVNGLSERTAVNDVANLAARSAVLTPLPNMNNPTVNQQSAPHSTPPPLQPRPGHPLDPDTPIGAMPVPSAAGPCSAKINQSAVKLADYFRNLLTESLQVLDEPEASVASLRLQLEQANWKHKQELAELKHNADVQVVEMQATLEREKTAALSEARRIAEMELNSAVDQAKSKQWCANCRQEAQFYCCWNTSYCDYPCQQAHWTQHYAVCSQQRGNPEQAAAEERTTHVKTVGGKVVARTSATAGVLRSPNTTGPSLLMNMQTGSSTSIAGSTIGYKRPPFNQPAFIINKQLMNAEESTAKVTPGGYLIVGAGNTGRPVVSHSQHTPIL